jgi:hypothetical protein
MIYFVSESRIKDFTPVLGNIDAKLISPLIPGLSDMWVKDRLGSYFYNIILTKYNNQTLSTIEEELVGIIQNTLIWRAASDIAITTAFQLTNKGPQEQFGQFSAQAGQSNVSLISKHYQQKAEYYDSRLRSFLLLNKDQFPDFTAKQNNDRSIVDVVPNKKQGYNKDITFF